VGSNPTLSAIIRIVDFQPFLPKPDMGSCLPVYSRF
jgi:hypothetical protein